VPYLPIDPKDLGRSYEAVIRVNSQSGKGGVAYLLQADHGLDLPRGLQVEFSKVVQDWTDRTGKEATSAEIWRLFSETYLGEPIAEYRTVPDGRGRKLEAKLADGRLIEGHGSGPVEGFVDALRRAGLAEFELLDYREHAVGAGADAMAAAYVEVKRPGGERHWGVGLDKNIVNASLKAVASAARLT
jgi:2-isopropylmalate synthase